jgi:hypothetical protein
MTVYFMGTELEDFPSRLGTIAHNVSASTRRTANTRVAIFNSSIGAEDLNYIETDAFSLSDFWTHVYFSASTGATTINCIKWYSGGTQKLAFRWVNTTTGQIEIRKWNGSSWDSLSTVTDPLFTTAVNVDFAIYIKLGNPGEFRVYFNNLPAISRNDLDLSGIGTIDKVRFQPSVTSNNSYWSEIIVADHNLIGSKIVSRFPTGNGSYQEWSNGAFGIVDDQDATGADLAVSGTVGQRTTYTHAAFTALGATEVLSCVKAAGAFNRDVGGPQNINFMTRIGSTDYNGSDLPLNVTQTRTGNMWQISPASGIAWTVTELNAAHFGVRSRT